MKRRLWNDEKAKKYVHEVFVYRYINFIFYSIFIQVSSQGANVIDEIYKASTKFRLLLILNLVEGRTIFRLYIRRMEK